MVSTVFPLYLLGLLGPYIKSSSSQSLQVGMTIISMKDSTVRLCGTIPNPSTWTQMHITHCQFPHTQAALQHCIFKETKPIITLHLITVAAVEHIPLPLCMGGGVDTTVNSLATEEFFLFAPTV